MKKFIQTPGRLFVAALLSIAILSCQKQLSVPNNTAETQNIQPTAVIQPQLQASVKRVQLLQANANRIAVSLAWSGFPAPQGKSQNYIIEAGMAGSLFDGWVELGNTNANSIDFTTAEFNRQVRQLFVTGFAENIILRVRLNSPDAAGLSTFGVPMDVTTYQPVTSYADDRVFRVPANFQKWKIDSAQTLVSPTANGEYEGYLYFPGGDAQFLLIKSDHAWNPLTTYYNIGDNKIGFKGNLFCVVPAGFYKFNLSTSTNKWSLTKINSWSVFGTSISADGNTDAVMQFNPYSRSWEITGNFSKGKFIFRANNSDQLVLGHNAGTEPGASEYNGAPIEITKAGNYTIGLSLLSAGNYSYSVQRNSAL